MRRPSGHNFLRVIRPYKTLPLVNAANSKGGSRCECSSSSRICSADQTEMTISLVFVLALVVCTSADAPPIPYTAAVASPVTFASDHVQPIPSYVDHEGYNLQSGYDSYLIPAGEHGFFPLVENLDLKTHGLLGKILKNLKALGWKIIPKLALGAAALLALFLLGGCVNALICTFTPFCTISFLGAGVTKETMRSYLTPDRITTTANFVMDAIRKYKDLYDGAANEIDTGRKKA